MKKWLCAITVLHDTTKCEMLFGKFWGEGKFITGRFFFSFSGEAHRSRRLIALVPQAKACIQGFSETFLAEIVIRDLRGGEGGGGVQDASSRFHDGFSANSLTARINRRLSRARACARAFHRWKPKPTGEKGAPFFFYPGGNFSNYKRVFLITLYTLCTFFLSPSTAKKLLPREILQIERKF